MQTNLGGNRPKMANRKDVNILITGSTLLRNWWGGVGGGGEESKQVGMCYSKKRDM